jgi:hypothetical protein
MINVVPFDATIRKKDEIIAKLFYGDRRVLRQLSLKELWTLYADQRRERGLSRSRHLERTQYCDPERTIPVRYEPVRRRPDGAIDWDFYLYSPGFEHLRP